MPIQNGSTDLIANILAGKRIADSNDIEIQQKLLKIFVLVGLRMQHYPDKLNNQFLINFIKKEYYIKTLDELEFAFELAIKQELDLDDYKVFDNFSIEYLVRIMNAYRIWLVNKNKAIQKKIEEIENQVMTTKEKLDEITSYLNRTDININNLYLIPLYIYDFMNELEFFNLTERQMLKKYKRATDFYEYKLSLSASALNKDDIQKYNRFIRMKENNFQNITPETTSEIENLYKRISVMDYIINYQKELNEK